MSVCGDKYLISGNFGGDDLADDVAVGKADNETVFRSIVFVLRLGNEAFASVVVGFTRAATLVLDLIATRARLVSWSTGVVKKRVTCLEFVQKKIRRCNSRQESWNTHSVYSWKNRDIPEVSAVLDQLCERL